MDIKLTCPPVYDGNSRVLILGAAPSPGLRRAVFYYPYPQNRFWELLGTVFREDISGKTENEKREFLLSHGIALWNVLSVSDTGGARRKSVKPPVPNNINLILAAAPIKRVFTTGGKAHFLYQELCYPETWMKAFQLPSPSRLNTRICFDDMVKRYAAIKTAIERDS